MNQTALLFRCWIENGPLHQPCLPWVLKGCVACWRPLNQAGAVSMAGSGAPATMGQPFSRRSSHVDREFTSDFLNCVGKPDKQLWLIVVNFTQPVFIVELWARGMGSRCLLPYVNSLCVRPSVLGCGQLAPDIYDRFNVQPCVLPDHIHALLVD